MTNDWHWALLVAGVVLGAGNFALLYTLGSHLKRGNAPDRGGEEVRRELEQVERRLLEIGNGVARMSQLRMHDSTGGGSRSYELAHRMAGRGAGADQVAQDCGLSLEEAELIVRLHREGAGFEDAGQACPIDAAAPVRGRIEPDGFPT